MVLQIPEDYRNLYWISFRGLCTFETFTKINGLDWKILYSYWAYSTLFFREVAICFFGLKFLNSCVYVCRRITICIENVAQFNHRFMEIAPRITNHIGSNDQSLNHHWGNTLRNLELVKCMYNVGFRYTLVFSEVSGAIIYCIRSSDHLCHFEDLAEAWLLSIPCKWYQIHAKSNREPKHSSLFCKNKQAIRTRDLIKSQNPNR